jgi:hypothetical protein
MKGFQKGRQKTGGKKRGSKNRTPSEIKQFVLNFVHHNEKEFQSWFDNLDQSQKMKIMIDLFKITIPASTQLELSTPKDKSRRPVFKFR